MSTPKEELIEKISQAFFEDSSASAEMISDDERQLEAILNRYAFGIWVSVEERLPEFKPMKNVCKCYIVKASSDENKILPHNTFATYHEKYGWAGVGYGDVTHWLDLELPEVGE